MNGFFTRFSLKRFEREGNNDLLLIKELGPGLFETRDLKRALVEMNRREQAVQEARINIYRIGACSAFFLFLSYVFKALGSDKLSLFFLVLFPVTIVFFSIGQVFLRRRFPAYIHYTALRKAIREELDFRQKDASIF